MNTTSINESTDKTILTVGMNYKGQIITKIEMIYTDVDVDYDGYGKQICASHSQEDWEVKGVNLKVFEKGGKCEDFAVIIHGNEGLCEVANDYN